MHKPFRDETILGSLEDFRALMHEIYVLQEPQVKEDVIYLQGENRLPKFPKNMSRWEFTLGGTLQCRGYILARQLPNGYTKLQFAYHTTKYEPIGLQFEEGFIDRILNLCDVRQNFEGQVSTNASRQLLFNNLKTYFNVTELREITFEMNIQPENFSSRRNEFARELLEHCERHQCVENLLEICQKKRPRVPWQ